MAEINLSEMSRQSTKSALLDSLLIETTAGDGGFRVLSGQRLAQFCGDHFDVEPEDVPSIGRAATVSLGNNRQLPAEVVDPATVDTFHVELTGISHDTAEHARGVLKKFFDEQAADALLQSGLSEPAEWSQDAVHRIDGQLDAQGFDLCIAGHRRGSWCIRHAHVVVADRWLVTFWQPPRDDEGRRCQGAFPLPGSRVRQHFTRKNIEGWSGPDRLARLIQDVMRHNEYQEEVISALIENWELRFFRAFGVNTVDDRSETLVALQIELSELRGFLGAIHLANKTLWRRAQNQPAFPAIVKDEILERCRDLERALDLRRDELRSAFALISGAAAEQQARAAEGTEDRMRALTALATYATGLVLVPGLIVGIYGANVLGLPGQGRHEGLWYLLAISLFAAMTTIGIFVGVRRSRR